MKLPCPVCGRHRADLVHVPDAHSEKFAYTVSGHDDIRTESTLLHGSRSTRACALRAASQQCYKSSFAGLPGTWKVSCILYMHVKNVGHAVL